MLVLAVVAVARSDERRRVLIALARDGARDGRRRRAVVRVPVAPLHEPVFDRPAGAGAAAEATAGGVLRQSRASRRLRHAVQDEPRQPLRAAAVHGRVGGLLRRLRLEQRRPPARRLGEARAEGADVARDRADAPARRRLARAPRAVALAQAPASLARAVARRAAAARGDRRDVVLHGQLPDPRRRRRQGDVHAHHGAGLGALLRVRPRLRARAPASAAASLSASCSGSPRSRGSASGSTARLSASSEAGRRYPLHP